MILKSAPSFLSLGIFKRLSRLRDFRISNNFITSCYWLCVFPSSDYESFLLLSRCQSCPSCWNTPGHSFSSPQTLLLDFPLKGYSSLSSELHFCRIPFLLEIIPFLLLYMKKIHPPQSLEHHRCQMKLLFSLIL